jgi:putative transposase
VPLHTAERFGQPVVGSIPTIVRSFKSAVTCRINELRGTPGAVVWQRGYLERVIRGEVEMERVRRYMAENALRWGASAEPRPNRAGATVSTA